MKDPGSECAVLITGCGSGIGQALALAFHRRGHRVYATARRLESMTPLAVEGIQTLAMDVTQASDIERVLTHVRDQGRCVTTLINNAGYGAMGPLLDLSAGEWRKQFDVNVFAPMSLMRAVAPNMMSRRKGMIVNISSVSGVMTTPFAGAYCASKAALNVASEALRMELHPFGVSVVTVQPGGIQSGFGERAAEAIKLADDSPYRAIQEGVMSRANESQVQALPAILFAEQLLAALERSQPPAVIRIGPKSTLLPLLKWALPRQFLDRILSRRFQLNRLS